MEEVCPPGVPVVPGWESLAQERMQRLAPCFPYVLGVTYTLGSPGSFENCLTGPNWARVNQTSKDGCRHQHPWRVPRGF